MNKPLKKILIVGASSDIASALNRLLVKAGWVVGLHYRGNAAALKRFKEGKRLKKFQADLVSADTCSSLVDEFVAWAGGIDCLIQLSGDIREPIHWEGLTEEHWRYDLDTNLVMPFFLAQRAIKYMKKTGGRIVLTSTASAGHGGGSTSMAYGVAKAGIECMVKGLARDCAHYDILINAVAPGFIGTKFHTVKMRRNIKQLEDRAQLIPLKRAGTPEEVAGAILFLVSSQSTYITGEVLAVSGGDWL